MKRILLLLSILSLSLLSAKAQETYFTIDELPDLVKCLPAPPDTVSQDFTHYVMRYIWGKTMRSDTRRASIAARDAIWNLDTLAAIFSAPFGMSIDKETTPEIYNAFVNGVSTIELIRIRPKAHFMRKRPFDRFQEHMYTTFEEDELRGEGSYPSGHTIRGWSAALVLAEINPEAANELYSRGWEYGVSRVIVGAHWQSDVDASRPAASIGYSLLQTSPAYREQMDKAREEFAIINAIDDYLASTFGVQYSHGDVCIPFHTYFSVDKNNPKDIQALGDYWISNYNVTENGLKFVSGGNHPGKMHLKQGPDGKYTVTSFDAVGDGAKFLPTAKRIFGNKLKEFQDANFNYENRERIRKAAETRYLNQSQFVADNIWTFSQTHPDGFTMNISTWKEPAEGIAVAYSVTQDMHDRDGLEFVVSHAQSHGGFVGGWLDTESGKYYYDSVRVFPEDSMDEAKKFGKENGQMAVYVISSGKEVRLE